MIEVDHLSKEFVTAKKYPGLKGTIKSLFTREKIVKNAVSDVSFSIAKGEIVGYIGHNGAGKSTTIKMMTGILVPTAGVCRVNGKEPYKHREENAKQIGVVFGQRTQLWWDLPLTETFTVLKEIYQVSDNDYKDRMGFIYDILDIKEFEHNTVRTLSLGQRMRADLGAALIHNPQVLFLDEPTIGLDVVVKEKIRTAIKEMNQIYDTTVILTTHDMIDIEELCKHIIIIDDGKIIYDGTLDQLKKQYGATSILELEVSNISVLKDLDLNRYFGIEQRFLTSKFDKSSISISFRKDVINVSSLVSFITGVSDVRDMRIKETDLTTIVKQIYTNGVEIE